MKRFAIIVAMTMLATAAWARPIHYFTLQQASRTVSYLNTQQELMIYYGYDYEIPTYVLLNEVWMERVNSSYYELWIYGYDAYTGDEIVMPFELQGIWLFSAGRIYNAAQYLRFQVDARAPGFSWSIPPYNPYTRVHHRPGYTRTYHYEIHRHGWMPPAYGPGHPNPPLPHYYMRSPSSAAPAPTGRWTPGVDRPEVAVVEQTHDNNPSTGTQVRSSHSGTTTGASSNRATSRGTTNKTATPQESPSANRATSRGSSTSTTATSTTPSRNTVRGGERKTESSERTTESGTRTTTRSTTRTSDRSSSGTTEKATNTRSTTRGSSTSTERATTTRGSSTSTEKATNTRSTTRGSSTSTEKAATPRSSERSDSRSTTRTTTTRGTR